jgi:hypothetical protein
MSKTEWAYGIPCNTVEEGTWEYLNEIEREEIEVKTGQIVRIQQLYPDKRNVVKIPDDCFKALEMITIDTFWRNGDGDLYIKAIGKKRKVYNTYNCLFLKV